MAEALAELSPSAVDALHAAVRSDGWLDPSAVTNEVIRSGLVQRVAERHRLLGVFGAVLPARGGQGQDQGGGGAPQGSLLPLR